MSKKKRSWGNQGGMSKHRKSGISYNHKHNIERVREENKRLEKERIMRKKRKGKMVDKVKDLFDNYD